MNVAVNQLTLRGACDAPHHQAFLIEDALNTQLSSEDRLVLVRTLSLLPLAASGSQPRDSRFRVADIVADSWSRVMAGAMHGSSDSASAANSVWFHDAAEAKAILLARLIRGQSVDAWFWTLAVKLWLGQPLAHWIAGELIADPPTDHRSESAKLLVQLVAADEVQTAEAALSEYLQDQADSAGAHSGGWHGDPFIHVDLPVLGDAAGKAETHALAQSQMLLAVAKRLRAKLPAALFPILRRLNSQAAIRAPLVRLAANFVTSAVPELRLRPKLLHAVAQHFLDGGAENMSQDGGFHSPSTDTKQPHTGGAKSQRATGAEPAANIKQRRDVAAAPQAPIAKPQSEARLEPANENPVAEPAFTLHNSEHATTAAGLFFLLNVLRELDWPRWLAARPEWLASNPSAVLLRYVARHHRVDPADPVFAYLDTQIGEQPPLDPELLRLWRIGIDRWLARHTRTKLASHVKRRGWLSWRDERLDVRFRMQDIDMRLRRLALDRDPGWTPWAGMTLRFHFSDTPLLRDGAA